MLYNWLEPVAYPVPEELQPLTAGQPLLGKILAQRGLASLAQARAFLQPEFYTPSPASVLPGLVQAAERLQHAIQHHEALCVWGDFDVDGQTATTVLVSTLQDLGAQVRHYIPVRERESHGVSVKVLKRLISEGVHLVMTCDTGISAHDAVEYARNQGVEFIVTDHHDLPQELPPAAIIANPKLLPATHPLYSLPGVGVAYLLAQELYHRAQRSEHAEQNLDLVALGIVADLAILAGDTRYLLQRGLRVLREARRLGLKILMETAEVNPLRLTEEHIGYLLAPRLNALGRLGDANLIVDFFTTTDLLKARSIANQLEGLNAQRQLLTSQVFQAAQAQIARDPSLLEEAALVLVHPTWPGGVIGIVASRLVEQYLRPVVLITAPAGEMGRGSARSVPGCNITEAIAAHSELLAGFGGHPMAAGFAIEPGNIPQFRLALIRTVCERLGETRKIPDLRLDEYISLPEINLELVDGLERLAPFGPGNLPIRLATRNLSLVSQAVLGRHAEHLQVIIADEQGTRQKAIWWHGAGEALPQGHFDLAYSLRASDVRGDRTVQMEWIDARPAAESVELGMIRPAIQVLDNRGKPQPALILKGLLDQHPVQVWCEGEAVRQLAGIGIAGLPRNQLQPCQTLAIWTTPPGRSELMAAIQRAQPDLVYLFLIDPVEVDRQKFLTRLVGLLKYALRVDAGRVSIPALAGATAQREAAVLKGLEWLAARGKIILKRVEEGVMLVSEPDSVQPAKLEVARIEQELESLLQETRAYRQYLAVSAIDF